jgi:hypothetical protein
MTVHERVAEQVGIKGRDEETWAACGVRRVRGVKLRGNFDLGPRFTTESSSTKKVPCASETVDKGIPHFVFLRVTLIH